MNYKLPTTLALILLSACTATNKYKGPNLTFSPNADIQEIEIDQLATPVQTK